MNKVLKTGFAHCKIVIHKPGYHVWLDGRMPYTEIDVYPNTFRIVRNPGETHIAATRLIEIKRHRGIMRPFTCVEQVKACLGIRKWWILTPYQLYRELKNGKHV